MDEKIYLSPAVKIVSLDKKNLYLKIYSKLYHLTGDKIEKYLLSNIEYFFSSKTIYEFTQLFSKKYGEQFDIYEFNEIIELLLEKEIFVKDNSYLVDFPKDNRICLICINYSSKMISSMIKKNLESNSKDDFLTNYFESYHEIPDNISSADIILVIMERWDNTVFADKLEEIKNHMNQHSVLLPVVLNSKYFSIGPQVFGEEDLSKLKLYLNQEESRSTYCDSSKDDTYYRIPVAFIINEIYFIVTKQNYNSYSYSRMLTYNLNSKEFKKIRYGEL